MATHALHGSPGAGRIQDQLLYSIERKDYAFQHKLNEKPSAITQQRTRTGDLRV